MRSPVKHSLLESIDDPATLRALPRSGLKPLADELRDFLLQSVSASGGHLASGLGTVELTLALHYCFDTDRKSTRLNSSHRT